MTVRGRIESAFTQAGWWVIRWRWLVILVCLLISAGLTSGLQYFRIDNSDEAFLPEDDEERMRYEAFKREYDTDDEILILVKPPEIFDLEFLAKLRAFHDELEAELPYLLEITSLLNARNTYGRELGDGESELVVEDLFENWPQNESELAVLRERAFANPLIVDQLLSKNGAYTIIRLVPFTYSTLGPEVDALAGFDDEPDDGGEFVPPPSLSEEEGREMVGVLYDIVDRYETPDFDIYAVGGPTMEFAMANTMQADVSAFMLLSNSLIAGLLIVLFRRVSGVVLPLAVVMLAMLSAMGAMSWLDIPFSVTLNMLPAFLIVVGICDSIHILVIVYRQLDAGMSRDESIAYALGHSGLAVVMTSITTAAGLVSFSVAKLEPVAHLGTVAPLGVLLAMLYSLVLLPALLAVAPLRAKRGGADRGLAVSGRLLTKIGDMVTAHPARVVAVWGLVGLLAVPGLMEAHFSHDGMKWFPKEDPLRQAADLIDENFGGSGGIEVVIRTDVENGLHEPDVMQRVERAMRFTETLTIDERPVSRAYSIVDIVKETHQALNENRPEFYSVPDERALLSQELLLFENSGPEHLEKVTDSQFTQARMTVRMPWVDAMVMPPFLDELSPHLGELLGPDLEFELTGGGVMFTRIFENVITTMARSYAFALAIITPMMILLIGDLKRGLFAMIPNLTPVVLVISFMGYLGIPLDMTSLLIGGVVIGVAVDDTIHFMHKFNRYYEDERAPAPAVHATLATTGAALLFTSVVLGLGFSVFMAAYMVNITWFGMLLTVSVGIAFLADITLAPALMMMVTKDRRASA